ncbi:MULTISPECIES: sugar ABC transporter ATP-binding protein [Citrobacter]|jgi:erythritol transport system ATP-binding protein|uniref:sugar ABC transporter ATP-binding protein n=1 Tax=Citrobacter TaxID=544 RepID=UPI001559D3F8|nr:MULTISPECIES: sugar ABC transporter ATP-binding protein [Citrobacter]MBR7615440.1 sugar ABC transporter ATP-binding protein [Citrobacter braakii]MDL4475029.1 sugar ABC transporter ATP-binding protein [Citrobacter braakii]MDL4506761.1 sugar ABC transporter ATP-binding protein [Citrobacter braakii]MDM3380154.1 sugar ABC transporter ATP-binding protein [Citrobacter sp. Cb003]MDM3450585.1 sugar ABC transporter ATP-binding protein [Citrobacter sp. Cb027]
MRNTSVDDIILRTHAISMLFPGTIALDSVDYQVWRGKVNVIIGENGAGKSTLMKILAGVQQPSSGEMSLNGNPVRFASTRDAAAHGIGMVHQELNLFENLTVAENIFLGREIQKGMAPINEAEQEKRTAELLTRLDQPISPRDLVGNLKVGQQQLVEIAKALAEDADILILDEPTSALSKTEVEILFRVIRELTRQGVSIIYISHRLEELMAIGDVITILRDGKFQAEAKVSDIDVPWIVREMLGSDPVSNFLEPGRTFGAPVLEAEHITCVNTAGSAVVNDVTFNVHAGEIVGIYGLMGAGRTELFECLLGTERNYLGKLWLDSKPVPQRLTTADRIRMGMSLVPEDRKRTGIFPISSVATNLTIASLWRRLQRGFAIARKDEEAVVASTIGNLSIKVSSPEVEIQALSGGNQQKVVIGRSLLTNPKILFLDEPTRGIDVGAKADVFRMMVQLSQQGIAVVFSTSDLKEIMAVSDRILVMSGGKLTADIARDRAEESALVTASAQGF